MIANAAARVHAAWERLWYAPEPALRLSRFRAAMALALALYVATRLPHAREWLTAEGFHPSLSVSPVYGPALPLLPGWALWPALGIWMLAITRIVVARDGDPLLRPALLVTLLGTVWVTFADPVSAFTINRLFIVIFAILLVAPHAEDGARLCWPTRALQITLLLQYFGAGWCKLAQGDWGERSDVLWTQLQGVYMTDAAAWAIAHLPKATFSWIQHGALGFELLAPLLLGVRRLRPVGLALGVGMHAIIAVLMAGLWTFSLQMVAFYLLFTPSAPRPPRTAARA